VESLSLAASTLIILQNTICKFSGKIIVVFKTGQKRKNQQQTFEDGEALSFSVPTDSK